MNSIFGKLCLMLLLVGIMTNSVEGQLFCFADSEKDCDILATPGMCVLTAGEVINNQIPVSCSNWEFAFPETQFNSVDIVLNGVASYVELWTASCGTIYECVPTYHEPTRSIICTVGQSIGNIEAPMTGAFGEQCASIIIDP